MESTSDTKTWVPYMNPKDCSQGFCSIYCPEWCYIVFPPPPPPFGFAVDDSTPTFSTLVISIIGILATAFLIVSYYAVISKYCKNQDSSSPSPSPSSSRRLNPSMDMELGGDHQDPSLHLHGNVSTKTITILKFKKEDCSVQETECSICLNEFHDDEILRFLPKCSHVFHQTCIDAWLKSHSNCPLCRANIGFLNCEIIEIPQEQSNVVEPVETEHGNVLETGEIGPPSTRGRSQIDAQEVRR